MTLPKIALGEIAPAQPLKGKNLPVGADVWQLNLDQIESNTGVILSKEYRPSERAGNSTYWFDERHVLFSKLRPYLNKVVLPDEPGIATTELVPLCPDPERLNRKYLAYYLRSKVFLDWVSQQVAGAKMPRVSMASFWSHEIPLPSPAEQKDIVKILDKARAIHVQRRAILKLSDQLLRSIFLDMFGDPITNTLNWNKIQLGKLSTIVRGSSPRPQGDPRFYKGPVPRLMVGDLTRDGRYVVPGIDSLTEEGSRKSRWIEAGTVVMAVSGNVGLPAILATNACIHDGFIAFTDLDTKKVKSEFLLDTLLLMKSTHSSREAGAIFKNLTTTQIKEMEIPVPPLELQELYAEKIAQVSRTAQVQAEAIAASNTLFESLAQNYFGHSYESA